jgi:hypothetical protein
MILAPPVVTFQHVRHWPAAGCSTNTEFGSCSCASGELPSTLIYITRLPTTSSMEDCDMAAGCSHDMEFGSCGCASGELHPKSALHMEFGSHKCASGELTYGIWLLQLLHHMSALQQFHVPHGHGIWLSQMRRRRASISSTQLSPTSATCLPSISFPMATIPFRSGMDATCFLSPLYFPALIYPFALTYHLTFLTF